MGQFAVTGGAFQGTDNLNGSNGSLAWYEPQFADFNGDGSSDILYTYYGFTNGTWKPSGTRAIWMSRRDGSFDVHWNPNNANGPSLAWYEPRIADFNGDGLSDIFFEYYDIQSSGAQKTNGNRKIWLSNGDGTFDVISNPNSLNGGTMAWYEPQFADFNGDGASDILYTYYGLTNGTWKPSGTRAIWMSRGDGSFDIDWNPNNANGTSLAWYEPRIADFNGDGRSDIFFDYVDVSGKSTGYRKLWLSVGNGLSTGFFVVSSLNNQAGGYVGYRSSFADFNGDGRADVFYHLYDAQNRPTYYRAALISKSGPVDLLLSVSNGLGSTSHIEYASLAASGAPYTKDSGANAASYPVMDLQAPAYVVSEVRADDGLGGVTTTRYRYGGLKYDHELRQTLGFRWREVEQVETGVVKRTEYRQDFPYIGRASKAETRVSNTAQGNGGLVRSSESQYLCEDFAGSAGCEVQPGRRYFVYQNQSIEKGWDIDGTALPETTTTSTYDSYGNATGVNVSVFDPATSQTFTKTTTNTYVNPGYSPANDTWILGRLTRAEVTSTSP